MSVQQKAGVVLPAACAVAASFDLCVSGKGPAQIAKQLKKDKIPTPGYSYYQKHGVELTGVDITHPYNWPCRKEAADASSQHGEPGPLPQSAVPSPTPS